MYELHHLGPADPDPFVTWQNGYHKRLSEAMPNLTAGYEVSTWGNYIPMVEEALNDFFQPIPGTDIPIVCVERSTGIKLVRKALEQGGAELTRKSEAGAGWTVKYGEDRAAAVRTDIKLNLSRQLLDIMREAEPSLAESCLVREGYVPTSGSRSARRGKRADDGSWTNDTGRLFSVRMPAYTINASGDPRLHEKIDRAFVRYGTNRSVYRAWQTKEDWRSRGAEAFEVTFRSLHLGAVEAGETRFCRLVIIPNKPTGAKLVKPAAFSPGYYPVFSDVYLDGERKELTGWSRKRLEEACWDGDDEVLDSRVFLNKHGRGLTIDTGRDEFNLVVKRARIRIGDRRPWMHLGRHDATFRALDDIEALDVPEWVKAQMRKDLADYMGWASQEEILAVYGARHFAARRAKGTIGFQDRHGAGAVGLDTEALFPSVIHSSFVEADDLNDLFDR